MLDRTLVFSVAMNGYQWRYQALIDSHRHYCEKNGYDYVCVNKPGTTTLGLEVAWLKIRLIIKALEKGYRWVVFLDADTRVATDTPPVQSVAQRDKQVYMANGYSGRVNSGVIIIRNNTASRYFFRKVLDNALSPLPAEDQVGWGENGHIIHYAKGFNEVQIIGNEWNNNHNEIAHDYIRHFSAGPFRGTDKPDPMSVILYQLHHYALAVIKRLKGKPHETLDKNFATRLEMLSDRVTEHYAEFKGDWQTKPTITPATFG
mgnify:CR=1 FL=1